MAKNKMTLSHKKAFENLFFDDEFGQEMNLSVIYDELLVAGVNVEAMGLLNDPTVLRNMLMRKHGSSVLTMNVKEVHKAVVSLLIDYAKENGFIGGTRATTPKNITATSFRINPPDLKTQIGEFSANQLRELAKKLGIKLKGTQKIGYVDTIVEEIKNRIKQIKDNPNMLSEGLSSEAAEYMVRLMTAFDPDTLISRRRSITLLPKSLDVDNEKANRMLFDELVQHALLFNHLSEKRIRSFHEVYFQWLPIGKMAGYMPVVKWDSPTLLFKGEDVKPVKAQSHNFLSAFDVFLSAIQADGVEMRRFLKPHVRAKNTTWLATWEHYADEAENIFNQRKGWYPDPATGISVPYLGVLELQAAQKLENQTGILAVQCDFFIVLAVVLNLVVLSATAYGHVTSTALMQLNAEAYEGWLTLSNEAKLKAVWEGWTENTISSSEIYHATRSAKATPNFRVVRAIGVQNMTMLDLAAEWNSLKRFVIRMLRGLPTQTWINWEEFLRTVFQFHPTAAHTNFYDTDWWFVGGTGKPRFTETVFDDWQKTTGLIITAIVSESLQWLGAVECVNNSPAPDKLNQPQAFRITGLGEWLFYCLADNFDKPLPTNAVKKNLIEKPIFWLDGLTWCVPPIPERAPLVTFSRILGEATGEPSTYKLTHESIDRALLQGVTLEVFEAQFLAFGIKIPPEAKKRFSQSASHFGRVRIYDGLTVVQFADDMALRELMASTSLAKHIIYQLSSRAVIIADSGIEPLRLELIAQGHTPKII